MRLAVQERHQPARNGLPSGDNWWWRRRTPLTPPCRRSLRWRP